MFNENCCYWCQGDKTLQKYHDEEWGIPLYDDRKHFEYLSMEVMQCGLNWIMMLKKRETFRKCFDDFDYDRISLYTEDKINEILSFPGMIKSRRKIEAIINNAKKYKNIIKKHGSFSDFLWNFTDNKIIIYRSRKENEDGSRTELSDKISSILKDEGFKYLGSITVYAHLQACGIVNDHIPNCRRYSEIIEGKNIEYLG